MADTVESFMQDMVPELDDLRRKRIFSDLEIRQIVQSRRQFEYGLQEVERKPKAYLDYIRYEVALECLRRRRSEELHWRRKSLSDVAGIRRMSSIFDRCTIKFKADKRLWYQYIDFCLRSGSTKVLAGILMKAVRLHPREVHFWLLAADRELKLGHVQAARSLLTRGLRCSPRSPKLWCEFLRLELQVASLVLEVHKSTLHSASKDDAEPEQVPEADPWAPARLLLKRGLRRLAANPAACASFLSVASECVRNDASTVGEQSGFRELQGQLRALIAEHRPKAQEEEVRWKEIDHDTAVRLWELWWSSEHLESDWQAISHDVISMAPFEVMRSFAALLSRSTYDPSAKLAMLEMSRAPRVPEDPDTTLAVLEVCQDDPDLASTCQALLERAVARHPSCLRLVALAERTKGKEAVNTRQLLQLARDLDAGLASQLLLLSLNSGGQQDEALVGFLEALCRGLQKGENVQPLVDVLLTHMLARGEECFKAATQQLVAAAARLWDLPRLRAQLLVCALEAELRVRGPLLGSAEEARRLSVRFEEVLKALEGTDEAVEWWLQYREVAERAARCGRGGDFPGSLDLHWRAMRSVVNQTRYAEQAHRRLQASPA